MPSSVFFLLGRGRSGTSLLRAILDSNPDILVAPEAMFVMHLYGKYRDVRNWNRTRILEFYDDLWTEQRLVKWGLDRDQLRQTLLAVDRSSSFADLCRTVYGQYALSQGRPDTRIIGDKNPHYSLCIAPLVELFPDSKFIHIVRDPRDNILSYQRVRFDVNGTAALAFRWRQYNEAIMQYRLRLPDRFMLLRFEDLVQNPAVELARLCSFLGVTYSSEMLEYYRQERVETQFDWHQNLSKPLDSTRIYAWKKNMDPAEAKLAEVICADVAQELGYALYYTEGSVNLPMRARLDILYGGATTSLEMLTFRVPLPLRTRIVDSYRTLTGSQPTSLAGNDAP